VLQASAEGYTAIVDGVAVATAPAGAQAESDAQLARARDALASLSQE